MFDAEWMAPIGFFLAVVAIIKIVSDAKTRNKLIDKGLDQDKARLMLQLSSSNGSGLSSLKWGMVLVGIGLAFFIGELFPYRVSDEVTFGLMFLFAGLGFLIYYPLAQKRQRDINDQVRHLSPSSKSSDPTINP